MKSPTSFAALETLGRVRLSESFFLRDFLHSEIAQQYGLKNVPDDPDLAIAVGRELCEQLLEPLQAVFGRVAVRSAYRSPEVNRIGNEKGHNCATNEKNRAGHIWDQRDRENRMGATACVVIPKFADFLNEGGDWRAMAWWIHDHLPYSNLQFFPNLGAFNIRWREEPERRIDSYIAPKGCLVRENDAVSAGDRSDFYRGIALFDTTLPLRQSRF